MITRQEVGKEIISKFTEAISDIAEVSKSASLEGNTMSVIFSPKKGK
jgi:translation initiation factor IF-3